MTRTVAKWLSVLDVTIVIIGTLICEASGNHNASILIMLAGADRFSTNSALTAAKGWMIK